MEDAARSNDSLEAEALRQKLRDVALLRTLIALIEDDGIGAELVNHLTASTTRRAGHSLRVRHRDSHNLELGPFCGDGGENCRALGAIGHSIRSILDVAADKDVALGSED